MTWRTCIPTWIIKTYNKKQLWVMALMIKIRICIEPSQINSRNIASHWLVFRSVKWLVVYCYYHSQCCCHSHWKDVLCLTMDLCWHSIVHLSVKSFGLYFRNQKTKLHILVFHWSSKILWSKILKSIWSRLKMVLKSGMSPPISQTYMCL